MRYKQYSVVLVLLAALCSMSITQAASTFPALTSPATEKILPGKFIWADLFSADIEASVAFYSKTFGWQVESVQHDKKTYYLLSNEGTPVAGISPWPAAQGETGKALWVNHISTVDVQAAVDKATSLGSKVHMMPKVFGQRGTQAIIADPQGAIIGLLHSDSGDPADGGAVLGKRIWAQLFSKDIPEAAHFYAKIFGYEEQAASNDSPKAVVMNRDGVARAAIAPLPAKYPKRDRWVSFILVDNLDSTLLAAKTAGAEVLYEPRKEILTGQLAIIIDPQGALIGLIAKAGLDSIKEQQR